MPKKFTKEEFVKRSRKIYGNTYNYSKVIYINSWTKVIIICPIDGEFLQMPYRHLQGHGCPKCGIKTKNLKLSSTTKEFVVKARKLYSNKYDYSKVVYKNAGTEVIIICPLHGKFPKTPHNHLQGEGCPKCGIKKSALKRSLNKETFIEKSIKKHGNKYDYSKVIYINSQTEVIINCLPHGYFPQLPYSHLAGHGCPKCKSSNGEKSICKWLNDNKILYIKQKSFKDCINPKNKHGLKYDFYLTEYNALIEFNGIQHYVVNNYWHQNKNTLESQQYRDQIKKDYALSHGYKFLVIKYNENVEEILNKTLLI